MIIIQKNLGHCGTVCTPTAAHFDLFPLYKTAINLGLFSFKISSRKYLYMSISPMLRPKSSFYYFFENHPPRTFDATLLKHTHTHTTYICFGSLDQTQKDCPKIERSHTKHTHRFIINKHEIENLRNYLANS